MRNVTRLLCLLPLLSACTSSPGDSPSSGGSGTTAGGSTGAGGSLTSSGGSSSSSGGTISSGGQLIAGAAGSLAASGGMSSAFGGASSGGSGGSAGATSGAGGNVVSLGGQAGASGAAGGGASSGGQSTGGAAVGGGGASGAGGKMSSGGTTGGGGSAGAAGSGGSAKGGASSTGGTTATGGTTSGVYKPAFILGADVTITLEDEYWGATYTDAGQEKSLEQLLKDHGFNFIRIDTFVDPGQSGGYSASMPETFRDLAHTIELGARVKRIGLGFLLDLHYSHTWTNPSAQTTPAAWSGQAIAALETSVYDYTKDALAQLKAGNAMPDMVQIGNEITSGMLWETGRNTSSFVNFGRLLKAGIRAVREADPAIQVMLHIEKCNNTETSRWFLDGVIGQGVAFDILGQSCYAPTKNADGSIKHPGYQGDPSAWTATFATLASAYPNLKFVIAEYSSEQRAANDVMFQLPNKRGLGTFNWDPTRAYDTHPNVPLFSTNGAWNRFVAIPESMALYEQMAHDYGLR
jgi:arabinogalactan endo-1,4-beta-galactosidase